MFLFKFLISFVCFSIDECGLSCDSDSDSDLDDGNYNDSAFQELQRKKSHPWRLHDELWYNDKGEVIVSGIHSIYNVIIIFCKNFF